MELKELMSAFAERLGIEGIEVKDGICSMTIDDIPMDFTLTLNPTDEEKIAAQRDEGPIVA